jgi:NAD(P)-dependent dehydrogenase (short-subunit alcohol dehydrogenase family)
LTVVPYSETRLDGRVALVTGGGTGIGNAIARILAQAGARVVVAGRREEPLLATVEELGGAGKAAAVPGDVTDDVARGRMLDTCVSEFGGLDILVNNAGAVLGAGPLDGIGEETWRDLFDVNVIAPVLLARAALPLLIKSKGVVLGVSTGSSLRPVSGFGGYGTAKAALNHAMKVFALEVAPDVRVNVICPGGIDTDIFETFLDDEETIADVKQRFVEMTPMGRMGEPMDIASAALWLCSDASRWVTGVILTVDGGLNLG